nr:MAG TPA: hypothetical protein [Bacteriophage sp.]
MNVDTRINLISEWKLRIKLRNNPLPYSRYVR